VSSIYTEDSLQGLGASCGEPTDKRPGRYQFLPPRVSCLLTLEEQNADAQDELSHELSKQGVEFINCYERLHQCIVFELAMRTGSGLN
jgi:hypothetical protein